MDIEGLRLNQSVWITATNVAPVPFSSIDDHFNSIADCKNNTTSIYFSSDIDLLSLPLLLAAWLKGYSLVPISETQPFHLKKRLIDSTGAISLSELVEKSTSSSNEIFTFDESQNACFIQTSGSSGLPKIVAISNKMILSANKTVQKWITPTEHDVWLLTLPIHHIGGLSILFRSYLQKFCVYFSPGMPIENVGNLITSGEIQFVSLVPTQLKRLLDLGIHPHFKFKKILLGGGPSSVKLLQDAVNAGFTIVNSFGMTETAAQFTGMEYKPGQQITHSEVGNCVPPNQFKLIPETDSDRNEHSGILWLKGPQVISSYPFANEIDSFADDWFCTGDYGRLNDSRNLEIQMRRTDRIVSGGENINPNEIELLLSEFDGISDCAAFGVQDEEWGQKLVLFYSGSAESDMIKAFLAQKMEGFKIPKELIRVDSIPRISISKINRGVLPDLYKSI